MNILILAGGSGTRLWPVSRTGKPKQLLQFIDNKTLLENTYARIRKHFQPRQIFVGTGKKIFPAIRSQVKGVPKTHFAIEPSLKDRGTAMGLAVLLMDHQYPGSSFTVNWSDHYIADEQAYFRTMDEADRLLQIQPENIIVVGVRPRFAHTGFEYLEPGRPIRFPGVGHARKLKSFKIRADRKTTEQYFKKGYLWNTGYLAATTTRFLELYKTHVPEVYKRLVQIRPALGTTKQQKTIDRIYPLMPKVDFETGFIKKLKQITVLEGAFDWIDVGSWKVVHDTISGGSGNIIKGRVEAIATEDSLIYNYEPDKLVATIGLKDVVVINTGDALLVADKGSSEEKIRDLITTLKRQKRLKRYL